MPAVEKLTPEQIATAMKSLPEWAELGEGIQRTYQFKDFLASMNFVNAVAQRAEQAQHHPDILVRYSRVTLTLTTHDAVGGGGVTERDIDFAKVSDAIAAPMIPPPPPAAPAKPSRRKK